MSVAVGFAFYTHTILNHLLVPRRVRWDVLLLLRLVLVLPFEEIVEELELCCGEGGEDKEEEKEERSEGRCEMVAMQHCGGHRTIG